MLADADVGGADVVGDTVRGAAGRRRWVGRDAEPLGHARRAARHPDHELLDAQHHAGSRRRGADLRAARASGSLRIRPTRSRSCSTRCTCTAGRRVPRSPTWSVDSSIGSASMPAPISCRVIAPTASLGPEGRDTYLKDFFAIERPFTRITARPVASTASEPALGARLDPGRLGGAEPATIVKDESVAAHIREPRKRTTPSFAVLSDGTTATARAMPLDRLAQSLFPDERDPAITADQLFDVIDAAGGEEVRLRLHHMFSALPGLWACSDPGCTAVDADLRLGTTDRRRSGRSSPLQSSRATAAPAYSSFCTARACGETFLGGYHGENENLRWNLVGYSPDLDLDTGGTQRSATNYVVYWPTSRSGRSPVRAERTWGGFTFKFRRARLDPALGTVVASGTGATGWVSSITGDPEQLPRVQGFPHFCPAVTTSSWRTPTDSSSGLFERDRSAHRSERWALATPEPCSCSPARSCGSCQPSSAR